MIKRDYCDTAAISDDLQHLAILHPSDHKHTLFYYNLKQSKRIQIPVEDNINEIQDIKFSKDNKLYYIFRKVKSYIVGFHYYDPQSSESTKINLDRNYNIMFSSTLNKYAILYQKTLTIKSLDQHYVVSHQFQIRQTFIIPSNKIIVVSYAHKTKITQHCNLIIFSGVSPTQLRETKKFKLVNKGGLRYICEHVMNMEDDSFKGNNTKQNPINNTQFFLQKQTIIKEVDPWWKHCIQIRQVKGIMIEFDFITFLLMTLVF